MFRKIAKKFTGRTENEDALKRLDRLTQKDRMATAQNLKVTHTVDKGVREVLVLVDTVIAMDDRIASVDNIAKGVDAKVVNISARPSAKMSNAVIGHGHHATFDSASIGTD